jgi:flagella basal body P-ring formation protein FlgA
MGALGTWMVLAATAMAGAACAQDEAEVRLDGRGEQALKEALLDYAAQQFAPEFTLDRQRAWLSLSGELPGAQTVQVRPRWVAQAHLPTLPLIFDVRAGSGDSVAGTTVSTEPAVQATLSAPLLREVWVATRRLRKGSTVRCADIEPRRRDVRLVPAQALSGPCALAEGITALRDIAAADAVRSVDIGRAPDVVAGMPVSVSVAAQGVNVTTSAVALADAMIGDQVDVLMKRPRRTLRTRVSGPGAVQLLQEGP